MFLLESVKPLLMLVRLVPIAYIRISDSRGCTQFSYIVPLRHLSLRVIPSKSSVPRVEFMRHSLASGNPRAVNSNTFTIRTYFPQCFKLSIATIVRTNHISVSNITNSLFAYYFIILFIYIRAE